MMAFRQMGKNGKRRRFFDTKVPTESGAWVKRPTGTMDKHTARKIDEMIAALGPAGHHAWDILSLVTAPKAKMRLSEMYAVWSRTPHRGKDRNGKVIAPTAADRVAHVRASLASTDLEPMVEKFETAMKGPQGVSEDSAAHYVSAVRLLIKKEEVFPSSRLTEAELRDWLDEMDDVEPGTVRKRGMGMRRFISWLRDRGIITHDPMAEIRLPSQGDPLCHYIDLPDVERLAEASHGQMRHLELVLPGTAMEVSVALAVRVRDVSKLERDIRAAGTKTHTRDRVVRVADFAWDAVLELMKGKTPDSLLFDQIPHRFAARDAHAETRKALVEKGFKVYAVMAGGVAHDYTLRDHRHSWAVRYARAGVPLDAIAKQLGHKDTSLVSKVYGRFVPKKEERDLYERMATARDEAIAKDGDR